MHILTGISTELGDQIRGKLIGVMAQLVYIVAVLVIAGVGALNVGDLLPKLVFKGGVILVGS